MTGDDFPAESSRWPRNMVGLFVVGMIVFAAVWILWPRPTRAVPEIPSGVEDAEVREALERVRDQVVENPRSADAWGEYGLTLLGNVLDRAADECFAEAARLNPRDVRWPYARAVIASKRNPSATVALLRQATAAYEPGPEYLSPARLFLAETLVQEGELEEAERLFREELEGRHNRERATFGLGLLARARGDVDAAVKYLSKAREHRSSQKKAVIQLASLYRARGEVATAAALEQESHELPDDAPWADPMLKELATYKVGRRARESEITRLEQDHDFAGAARTYLEQVRQRPTAGAYIDAAANYARLREYEAAQELIEEAIRLDPRSSKAYYTRALVSMTQAERELSEDPDSEHAKGLLREVVAAGKKAAELKPDHAQAYLMWGMALKHLGEPEAAIEPLRRGIVCRPELLDLHLGLADALLELGQTDEAKRCLADAERLRPDDPRLHALLQRARARSN